MLDSLFSQFNGFFLGLLKGTIVTLELSLLALIIGLVFAIILALLGLSHCKAIKYPVDLIVNIVRALPELLVLAFFAFGLPVLLFELYDLMDDWGLSLGDPPDLPLFTLAVMALALIFASYASQTLRGALEAVSKTQWESCAVLGISKSKTFITIIMPQMWRHAIPGLGNQWLVVLKDSALVSIIGVVDLMSAGRAASTNGNNGYFTWLLITAFIYLIISLLSQQLQKGLQLFLSRHERV